MALVRMDRARTQGEPGKMTVWKPGVWGAAAARLTWSDCADITSYNEHNSKVRRRCLLPPPFCATIGTFLGTWQFVCLQWWRACSHGPRGHTWQANPFTEFTRREGREALNKLSPVRQPRPSFSLAFHTTPCR